MDTIGKVARTASGAASLDGAGGATGGSPRSPLPMADVLIDGFVVPEASVLCRPPARSGATAEDGLLRLHARVSMRHG